MTARYGSDVIVELLTRLGVDILPFAPGATFRGIHDSLIAAGHARPEIIECLHEEISVAVAHGYAKASGRLGAAALHDIVGLQHASMAIYNAWCDRAPLLLLGGTGPVDAALRRPWIDWIHTANIQATQVRDYTKWDDQPASLAAAQESLVRGARLAAAAPSGPVYLTIDSVIQEAVLDGDSETIDPSIFASAECIAAPAESIRRVAERLRDARAPLIAVESIGRNQQAFDDLVAVSEALGAAVVEVERDYNRSELCFPTCHPLNASGMPLPYVPDVVLTLEVRDLDVIRGIRDAAVLQVTTSALGVKAWAADLQRVQPTELLIHAEPGAVLAALRAELEAGAPPGESVSVRRAAIADGTRRYRSMWLEEAAASGPGITPAALALHLNAATIGTERVLANGSLHNWVHRLWDLDGVDQYLGSSGGAGLGYGLGASIGAALAHRGSGRLVIDIQSDGDALMTPGALWTAAKHRVPLLIVVENNRRWGNSYLHARRIAESRERSVESAGVGTVIDDPPVDFIALAASFGVRASWRVESRNELDGVLAQAIARVRGGEPALVDVATVDEY